MNCKICGIQIDYLINLERICQDCSNAIWQVESNLESSHWQFTEYASILTELENGGI